MKFKIKNQKIKTYSMKKEGERYVNWISNKNRQR